MKAERGKRELGAVYTPPALTEFMVSLAAPPLGQAWNVLEPACADAPFLQAWAAKWGRHHALTGVEVNMEADKAFAVPYARHVNADYLLWQPAEQFDLIIGNPPYGIIGAASHYAISGTLLDAKKEYKARLQTWRGKYNIYAAFIEQSVHLLKHGGQLVFVVPTTWLVLDDFILLRKFLSERGKLEVYYKGKAFDGVTVVAVVLHFTKGRDAGLLELYDRDGFLACRDTHYNGDLICFRNEQTDAFEQRNKAVLGDLFDVRFAARSPEFQKSPFVTDTYQDGLSPVLTGRNLHPGQINYEKNYSGLWINNADAGELRPFYKTPHIVVAHTKGAKVVAAIDAKCFAWREDFHLVPRIPIDEAAVETYLNSAPVQNYVQTLYRDLTPHLTRTQLVRLPMPAHFAPALMQKRPAQMQLVMERAKCSL